MSWKDDLKIEIKLSNMPKVRVEPTQKGGEVIRALRESIGMFPGIAHLPAVQSAARESHQIMAKKAELRDFCEVTGIDFEEQMSIAKNKAMTTGMTFSQALAQRVRDLDLQLGLNQTVTQADLDRFILSLPPRSWIGKVGKYITEAMLDVFGVRRDPVEVEKARAITSEMKGLLEATRKAYEGIDVSRRHPLEQLAWTQRIFTITAMLTTRSVEEFNQMLKGMKR